MWGRETGRSRPASECLHFASPCAAVVVVVVAHRSPAARSPAAGQKSRLPFHFIVCWGGTGITSGLCLVCGIMNWSAPRGAGQGQASWGTRGDEGRAACVCQGERKRNGHNLCACKNTRLCCCCCCQSLVRVCACLVVVALRRGGRGSKEERASEREIVMCQGLSVRACPPVTLL